ncbi:trypsin-like isoform X1 [Cylas formicarius]|uniref:trypsin-like isoform X1 n=1 Tax=Cylas formicarius TaxID=197179 RepID=UPI0029584275|nr:trypsin-like isoform X1 [Cylas formicarius]
MKTITILVVIASYISAGPTNPSGRISYGEVAERGQFPYQVSVQLSLGFTFYPSCGGSILSPEYILTAAHCFPIPGAASYQVLAGITNVYDVNVGEQRRNVLNYVIHELYQSGFVLASPHDIAVVQLTDPLIYTDTIKPIALPPVNAEFTGIATLSGWGETETGRESSILLYAEIPLIDVTECNNALVKLMDPRANNPFDSQTNICTFSTTYQSSCTGDSGGPLALNGTLIGIVSWGMGNCGDKIYSPSVYVKVSKYIDWIQQHSDL